jgi:hypothetical protein
VSIALSTKTYTRLGKLLLQKEPETAAKLIALHLPQKTHESDISKIPDLFQTFCKIQNIDPDKYRGPLYKGEKSDQRRLFIAAIVQMYGEAWGLGMALSRTLVQDSSATRRIIMEVDFRYKKISEFQTQVNTIIEKIRGNK